MTFRCLPALLLLATAPWAHAQSGLPDPVPPAVVGRPLDAIRPSQPVPPNPMAAKPQAPKAAVRATPPKQATRAAPAKQAVRPPVVPATQAAGAAAAPPDAPPPARAAKQAVDDRADPRMRLDDVGKGTHLAHKPLGPGAYFGSQTRAAVQKYLAEHAARVAAVRWQIGEPVPRGARASAPPPELVANLPKLPPGHRYLQLGGDVVLVAEGSNMVVDGISRALR